MTLFLSRSDNVNLAMSFMAREPVDNPFCVASATAEFDSALHQSSLTRRDGFTMLDSVR